MRLNAPLALSPMPFSVVHSFKSLHKSVYILIKWCCVVAFFMISCIKISRWPCVLIPHSINSPLSFPNFSRVILFKMDLILRVIVWLSSASSVVVVSAVCLSSLKFFCCALQELEDTSKGTTGSLSKSSRYPLLFCRPTFGWFLLYLCPRMSPSSRRGLSRPEGVPRVDGDAPTPSCSEGSSAPMLPISVGFARSPWTCRYISSMSRVMASPSVRLKATSPLKLPPKPFRAAKGPAPPAGLGLGSPEAEPASLSAADRSGIEGTEP
mmetsp:Transcript_45667/g.130912  ORF Transcript_45667/g.130912 Transcript_45667/m.130912 type:complete len:266 (-) Transcript_45667:262-1059(-)